MISELTICGVLHSLSGCKCFFPFFAEKSTIFPFCHPTSSLPVVQRRPGKTPPAIGRGRWGSALLGLGIGPSVVGTASDAPNAPEAGQPLRAQVLLRQALAEAEELYIQRTGKD